MRRERARVRRRRRHRARRLPRIPRGYCYRRYSIGKRTLAEIIPLEMHPRWITDQEEGR